MGRRRTIGTSPGAAELLRNPEGSAETILLRPALGAQRRVAQRQAHAGGNGSLKDLESREHTFVARQDKFGAEGSRAAR